MKNHRCKKYFLYFLFFLISSCTPHKEIKTDYHTGLQPEYSKVSSPSAKTHSENDTWQKKYYGYSTHYENTMDNIIKNITYWMNEKGGKRLAIADFKPQSRSYTEAEKMTLNEILARLNNTKEFSIVEKQLFNKAIATLSTDAYDLVKQSTDHKFVVKRDLIKNLGELTDADMILTGSVIDNGSIVKLNIYLVGINASGIYQVVENEGIVKDEIATTPTNSNSEEKTASKHKIKNEEGKRQKIYQITGKVIAIDMATKKITVKKGNNSITIRCNDDTRFRKARNINGIKIGDKVVIKYVEYDNENIAKRIIVK